MTFQFRETVSTSDLNLSLNLNLNLSLTRFCTLAMAGHVDHGKTSLIKALTGINPDRLKEEQERQMTTDLGFAHLALGQTDGKQELMLGFIDVPGHGKFLKNMLAGVGGVSTALLVVAADEGPMPQTLQHIKILSLLGVRACLLALTKIDLASAEQADEAEAATASMLDDFGIELISTTRVNAVTGEGVSALKEALKKVFDGGTSGAVLGSAPSSAPSSPSANASPATVYLPVDRVFSKAGHGTVITGTLVEGSLKVGQQLTIEPGHLSARVRGLETFGRKVEAVASGQRVAANLSLKENVGLARGHSLIQGDRHCCTNLIVELVDAGGLEFFGETTEAQKKDGTKHHKHQIAPQEIKFYHGTAELKGGLRWLEALEPTADSGQRPRFLAQIHLSEAAVARCGDRFVVRYGDDGIAGGRILLCDRPRWLSRKLLVENEPLLLGGDAQALAVFVLSSGPRQAVLPDDLVWAVPQNGIRLLAESNSDVICSVAGHLMSVAVKAQVENGILKALSEIEKGKFLTVEGLKSKFNNLSRPVFQALLKGLEEKNLLERQEDKIFAAGVGASRAAEVAAPEDAMELRIVEILAGHPCLELDELAKQTGLDQQKLKGYLDILGRKGKTAIINYEFAATTEKVLEAHKLLERLWQTKRDISPADFRDGLSTSRKYALALLAYFDDHQITRRLNTGRVLLKAAKG